MGRLVREADIPFMVVGAHAVFVHGQPRFSADIDLALHWKTADREEVRRRLSGRVLRDFEWISDEEGSRWLCLTGDGVPVELFLAADSDVHHREFERRVERRVSGVKLPFISPEDLVLRKLVNARLRRGNDFVDAVGVVRVQGGVLDRDYIRRHCGVHRVCGAFEEALRAAAG